MIKKYIDSYKYICKQPTEELPEILIEQLKHFYTNILTTETYDYIAAEGEIPIALVAHMDTAFPSPPVQIYYDKEEGVCWSPQGGVGDDRAGIFLIFLILKQGLRPHIFFLNDEEYGGIGASRLVTDLYQCPFDVKFFIELDRRGRLDAVFYNCENEDFTNYITSFGFHKTEGIFSDISIICPAWEIAGVNLSIGYQNEHSQLETWNINYALETFYRVINILKDEKSSSYYNYVTKILKKKCDCCGRMQYEDFLLPGVLSNGQNGQFCPTCIALETNWCQKCHKAFIGVGDLCARCLNEKR